MRVLFSDRPQTFSSHSKQINVYKHNPGAREWLPPNKRNFFLDRGQSEKFLAILCKFRFVSYVNEIWFAVACIDVTSFNEVFFVVVVDATAEPK